GVCKQVELQGAAGCDHGCVRLTRSRSRTDWLGFERFPIDRFESIKGLGIEAKTRQLDTTIDKAEIALNQLRELTNLAGATLLRLHSGVGRLDAPPTAIESQQLAMQIRRILQAIGASEQSVKEAMGPWLRVTATDVFFWLYGEMEELLRGKRQTLENSLHLAPPQSTGDISIRLEKLNGFMWETVQREVFSDHETVPQELMKLVADVPEITEDERREFLWKAEKGASELRNLFEKYEFADAQFWCAINARGLNVLTLE
ncbi:hypothetical protein M4R23_25485, partial [Acidovorax sp. GBBC 3332]